MASHQSKKKRILIQIFAVFSLVALINVGSCPGDTQTNYF